MRCTTSRHHGTGKRAIAMIIDPEDAPARSPGLLELIAAGIRRGLLVSWAAIGNTIATSESVVAVMSGF
jgi:hypothetical protein